MTNESDGSYSANVTISNYVTDHECEQPWKLAFIWLEKETLLSTLGAEEGTQQHGFISFGEGDADTYCLNNLTFVDSPQQNSICGTVILPRLVKADMVKSSASFQVSVSHSNRGYREQPPSDVALATRGFKYEVECDSMEQVTDVHLSKSIVFVLVHPYTYQLLL